MAEKFGFAGHAATLIKTWIPDYKMPGISSAGIATAIAGALGTLIMFGLACVIGRLLVREKPLKTRLTEFDNSAMKKETATRFSVSLPPALLDQLDEMTAEKGYDNRSLAIADMIRAQLIEHRQKSDSRRNRRHHHAGL